MDDGKPSGPKAKWWSRPSVGHETPREPEAPPSTDRAPVEERTAVEERPPVEDGQPAPEAPAPGVSAPGVSAAGAPAPEGLTREAPPAPVTPVEPGPQDRPRPLHEPDAYSTPPYGGPGPWAPAPPVQLPTPAHGTPMAPPYAQDPYAGSAGPQVLAQGPAGPAAVSPPSPQWLRYDPWSTPGPQQPLTQCGEPGGKRRRAGTAAVAALVFAGCVFGGAVGAYIERNGGFSTVELPQAGPESGGRAPESVAGIAASALPSVVTLHVSGEGEQGTGTGFVLDQRGHILTNNHVVQPAGSSGEISVTFSGGETASAKLVGKDSGYDLAVVKVTGVTGLKPLPLGNSDNVQVGDPVVAIGAPFDLSNTVTSGIISAKQRPITAGGEKGDGSDISYVDALQTDAPINPGNSGGPLVDSKARVIGINSAIRAADSGTGLGAGQSGSIGLGFAIPINQGKRVAEELINTGRATHPIIGVSLDMEYAGDGARVGAKAADGGRAVTADGPGDRAGIKPGDVITQVDKERVHSGEELIVKIRAHRPGDKLELTLVRGGEERTMSLTLGSADGS
ncbi:trypsin-like peptidase domain-containing protein [Streptomyces sp. NPDC088554]|uniref:S1C family serine protease n=1 Tax=Streptomyces sp. NPDC088554 TaxID=3365865 RepID=UPI0038113544